MSLHSLAVRRLLHPLHLRIRGHYVEETYLREFERSQFLSSEELRQLQLRRLQFRLQHAYDHCAYYRERWNAVKLRPSDVRALEDLARFPILTKADIQAHRDEMVADDMPAASMRVDQTGGSTGCPISYFQSWDVHNCRAAATRRHNRWAGYQVGDKAAWIWGAPRDIPPPSPRTRFRNWLLDRQIYLDTADFTEAKLRHFNQALHDFRPKHFFGYARALAHVARFYDRCQLEVYRPQSIITSAEMLSDEDRQVIERTFQAPVFNRYGCREVGVLASECEYHAGLHTMAEGLFIEIVVGDRLAEPGEVGRILVTDLLNFAMPLIRYEIGDMASFEPAPCPCGRGLPRLKNIAGRVTDFVVGPDGRLVSGVFLATYVVAKRPSLGQVQIWQDTPGELIYKIASRPGTAPLPDDLDFLRTSSERYVGPGTAVTFQFVDEITAEASGKFIFCHSTVDLTPSAI